MGIANELGLFNIAGAWAQSTAGEYKALVCVFLFGGNDGNNAIVPLDATGYAQYAAVRTQASGIQLAQASLLPIKAKSGAAYGLHPKLTELQTLFGQGRLAVVANVGTLVAPTTVDQYKRGVNRPDNLFSHSDQQAQWQTSESQDIARLGWGGRIADYYATANAGAFPVITSIAGTNLFVTGSKTAPLTVPASGSFGLNGYNGSAPANARLAALRELLTMEREQLLIKSSSDISQQAIDLSNTVNPILSASTSQSAASFAGLTSSIAQQLQQVAKMIEARAQLGVKRQVFFVSLGGFDTHNNQFNTQETLFGQLSPALKAFYDATEKLGVANQVTTFTLSDFGRTLKPAAGGGSDHAWGNHHLVMGGAVKGGDIYGKFPQLVLGGADDVGNEGRWLPTTSVDQYAATLARWFEVPASDLALVVPNIGRFAPTTLPFMG